MLNAKHYHLWVRMDKSYQMLDEAFENRQQAYYRIRCRFSDAVNLGRAPMVKECKGDCS